MKHWNEIVEAFETQRQILEAARQEYDQACKSVVEQIQARLRDEHWPLPESLRLEPFHRKDEGIGQYVTGVALCEGDLPWAWLGAWVASAYDGPLATVRVAAGVDARTGVFILPTEQLRQQASKALGLTAGAALAADLDEETVAHASLDIRDGQVTEHAVRTMRGHFDLLRPLLESWCREEVPVRALYEAKRQLVEKPVVNRQKVSPVKGDLGSHHTMRHVCLVEPKPSIWIGYDQASESLVAVHDGIEGNEGLTKRLAKRLDGQVREFEGYPAIRLGTRAQLRKLSCDETVSLILTTFRLFYEMQR